MVSESGIPWEPLGAPLHFHGRHGALPNDITDNLTRTRTKREDFRVYCFGDRAEFLEDDSETLEGFVSCWNGPYVVGLQLVGAKRVRFAMKDAAPPVATSAWRISTAFHPPLASHRC